jgi:hypothetical protein
MFNGFSTLLSHPSSKAAPPFLHEQRKQEVKNKNKTQINGEMSIWLRISPQQNHIYVNIISSFQNLCCDDLHNPLFISSISADFTAGGDSLW